MQTDPIGYKDGMNWYAYVGNAPINHSDSLGLKTMSLGACREDDGGLGCSVLGDLNSRRDEAKLRKQVIATIDLTGSKVREVDETGDPAIYKMDIGVFIFRNGELSIATPTVLNSHFLGYHLKDNMAVSPIESDATRMIVVATGDIKRNGN